MSSFTKGKWKVGSNSFASNVFAEDKLIATLVSEPSENSNEREANARLIASAPEMYQQLRRVVSASCEDKVGLKVEIWETLARIDGKEID